MVRVRHLDVHILRMFNQKGYFSVYHVAERGGCSYADGHPDNSETLKKSVLGIISL